MRYRVLGPSGIRVGELALGTRTFGTAWEWGADKAECGSMLEDEEMLDLIHAECRHVLDF